MESKKLRAQQSLKEISPDPLSINGMKKKKSINSNNSTTSPINISSITSEIVPHLPILSKKANITSSIPNFKKSLESNKENINRNYNKFEKTSLGNDSSSHKSNLLLNNSFIEISIDDHGSLKRRSLKNESIIDLIGSSNHINRESLNFHVKPNGREKKMVPQWQNLINDFANDLSRGKENKLKSPSKVTI